MRQVFYAHSGAVPIAGLLAMAGAGAVGAVVLGAAYGYGIYWIPFVYLNLLMTAGFGFGVGFSVGLGARAGRVRSPFIAGGVALLAGIAATYVQWVVWLRAMGLPVDPQSPEMVLSAASIVNELGAWSLGSFTPTGAVLWVFWGLEAVITIGLAAFTAHSVLADAPFCEDCSRWLDAGPKVEPLVGITAGDHLMARITRGDLSPIHALERAPLGRTDFVSAQVHRCPACRQLATLVLTAVQLDAKDKRDEKRLLSHLLIDHATADRLQKLDGASAQAAETPALP